MRSHFFVPLTVFGAILSGVGATPTQLPSEILAELTRRGGSNDSKCRSVQVRKEWRSFTPVQKQGFIAAVVCLADKKRNPHSNKLKPVYPRAGIPAVNPSSSYYDDLTYIHMDQTNMIHYTGFFLPWHRWYLNTWYTELKNRCGYQGVMPYWDWSKDAASFNTSAMWDPNPVSGLGTFGDPNKDYQVTNGGFSKMSLAYPVPHAPRRQYNPYPYLTWWWVPRPQEAAAEGIKQSYVDTAVNGYRGDFVGFQNAVEKAEAFHANIHMILGGDMAGTCPTAAGSTCQGGSTWTPNDPMFFLHHANIDRIWWKWQWKSPSTNMYAFKGGSNMTYSDPAYPNGYPPWLSTDDKLPTDGLYKQPSISDMMNTLTNSDLCYVYDA